MSSQEPGAGGAANSDLAAAATLSWQQALTAELQSLAGLALKQRGTGSWTLADKVGEAWRAVRDLESEAAVRVVVGRLGEAFEAAEGDLAARLRRCLDLALSGGRLGLVDAVAEANHAGEGRYWVVIGPDGISLHDERGDDEAFATVATEALAVAALWTQLETTLAQESAPPLGETSP
ncbi:MAG: hypothetical protein GC191_07990 [Azospirillum sp.]|nr:hypothetical protein [Azospirillum sp.]